MGTGDCSSSILARSAVSAEPQGEENYQGSEFRLSTARVTREDAPPFQLYFRVGNS